MPSPRGSPHLEPLGEEPVPLQAPLQRPELQHLVPRAVLPPPMQREQHPMLPRDRQPRHLGVCYSTGRGVEHPGESPRGIRARVGGRFLPLPVPGALALDALQDRGMAPVAPPRRELGGGAAVWEVAEPDGLEGLGGAVQVGGVEGGGGPRAGRGDLGVEQEVGVHRRELVERETESLYFCHHWCFCRRRASLCCSFTVCLLLSASLHVFCLIAEPQEPFALCSSWNTKTTLTHPWSTAHKQSFVSAIVPQWPYRQKAPLEAYLSSTRASSSGERRLHETRKSTPVMSLDQTTKEREAH
jgi:hypothetical protein